MKAIKVNGEYVRSLWYNGKKIDGHYVWFIETTLDEAKAEQYDNSPDGEAQLKTRVKTLSRKYQDIEVVDIKPKEEQLILEL